MLRRDEPSRLPSFRAVAVGLLLLVIGYLLAVVVSFDLTASDFVVFSTALVGVLGSYSVYRRRRRDATQRLRQSLFAELSLVGDQVYAEIRDMTVNRLGSELYVPDESPIVTNVYRNNAGELGRLTDEEVEKLASFYTLASIVRPRVERMIESDEVDAVEVARLRRRLVELYERRNDALDAMRRELLQPPVDVEYETDIEGGDDVEQLAESLGVRESGS